MILKLILNKIVSDYFIFNFFNFFAEPIRLRQDHPASAIEEDLIDYSESEEEPLPKDSEAPLITSDKWHPISTGSREAIEKIKFKKNIVPLNKSAPVPVQSTTGSSGNIITESKLSFLSFIF